LTPEENKGILDIEGLRSGKKTLPWQKHPSYLDRVTLRVALSLFRSLFQPIPDWNHGIQVCVRLSSRAFKNRLVLHFNPIVVDSFAWIAHNQGRTFRLNQRALRQGALNLLQNLIDGVGVLDASAVVKVRPMKQYLRADGRESHGCAGGVYLVQLIGSKEPNPDSPWPLARLDIKKIAADFFQAIGKERQELPPFSIWPVSLRGTMSAIIVFCLPDAADLARGLEAFFPAAGTSRGQAVSKKI
jgi:hypothetical protein